MFIAFARTFGYCFLSLPTHCNMSVLRLGWLKDTLFIEERKNPCRYVTGHNLYNGAALNTEWRFMGSSISFSSEEWYRSGLLYVPLTLLNYICAVENERAFCVILLCKLWWCGECDDRYWSNADEDLSA